MPLETDYINPDVILTTRVTRDMTDKTKYVKSAGLILVTLIFCTIDISISIWLILLAGGLWWGGMWYFKRRPTIVLEGSTKKIQLSGITKFARSQTLPINLVEKVTVMADVFGREKGQYIPQLVLKDFKGGGKKLVINCFPVEDIVQAHYTAQLLATFSRSDAYDFKGNHLPILSTHIPSRFRINGGQSLKSVASKMKKPAAQQGAADAEQSTA